MAFVIQTIAEIFKPKRLNIAALRLTNCDVVLGCRIDTGWRNDGDGGVTIDEGGSIRRNPICRFLVQEMLLITAARKEAGLASAARTHGQTAGKNGSNINTCGVLDEMPSFRFPNGCSGGNWLKRSQYDAELS